MWLGDIPALGASRCPDRAAIVYPDRGRRMTYSELDRASNAFAAMLSELGVRAGERVAYLGRNNDLFLPVLFGAARCGTVVVPLNWRLTPGELAYQLQDSHARLLMHDPDLRESASSAAELSRSRIMLMSTEADGSSESLQDRLQRPAPAIPTSHDHGQVLLQLYTSGTTGRPKGVLVSQHALSVSRHAELQSHALDHLGPGCVIVSAMPNSHIGGISWVMMGLVRFGTVVLTADVSPGNLIRLLNEYRAEHTFIVPTVLRAIVDELRGRAQPVPRLKGIFYGAMAMSESLLHEALQLFDCAFVQFFGMTEMSGSATLLSPEDHDPARPDLLRTVGRPYPGAALEIRGPDRAVLNRNEPGEIWIRSPTIMLGYHGLPGKTAEAVVGDWYASGDGGFLDEAGYLHLTDRIKDMIVSGGENVYPAEVEEALRRHPAVLDAAVVAVSDERWGEMVTAAVELRPQMSVDAAELQSFARQHIAAFKCPKLVCIVERLPRTASGKVQRAEVRHRLQAERSGA